MNGPVGPCRVMISGSGRRAVGTTTVVFWYGSRVADHRGRPWKRTRARTAVPPARRADRVRGPGRGWQRRDGAADPGRGRPRGRVDGGHHGTRTGAGRARGRPAPHGARGLADQQRGRHTGHAVRRPGRGRRGVARHWHQSVGPDLGAYKYNNSCTPLTRSFFSSCLYSVSADTARDATVSNKIFTFMS